MLRVSTVYHIAARRYIINIYSVIRYNANRDLSGEKVNAG